MLLQYTEIHTHTVARNPPYTRRATLCSVEGGEEEVKKTYRRRLISRNEKKCLPKTEMAHGFGEFV